MEGLYFIFDVTTLNKHKERGHYHRIAVFLDKEEAKTIKGRNSAMADVINKASEKNYDVEEICFVESRTTIAIATIISNVFFCIMIILISVSRKAHSFLFLPAPIHMKLILALLAAKFCPFAGWNICLSTVFA